MPFPKSQRILFTKNPLEQVVCQLKFPTILSISANEPHEFQELIRHDYPVFTREVTEAVPQEISAILRQIGGVTGVNEAVHYKFTSDDATRVATLNKEFIALTELNYQKWEDFYTELEKIRAALEKIYEPAFYTRIGLRYVDVIDKQKLEIEEIPWSDLLIPEFIGALKDRDVGTSIKLMREDLSIDLSTEIPDANVRVQHGLIKQDNPHVYFIDADFYVENRRKSDDIPGILSSFNELAGNLFRWSISPRLRKVLS